MKPDGMASVTGPDGLARPDDRAAHTQSLAYDGGALARARGPHGEGLGIGGRETDHLDGSATRKRVSQGVCEAKTRQHRRLRAFHARCVRSHDK